MDFQQEILAWSILSISTLCLDFEFLIKKIQTSLGWDFARDCRSDKKVVCEWVQTTDEGFSRPLILSIHLSASKFANLDVTASRKSKIFDRFCASGWSGLRDPQPLTESQSCSSILANRHYFVCCKRKKESVLLQTDRHFLCRRTFLFFFMSWWRFKICSAWQRALWQEFGCWQDKDKTDRDARMNWRNEVGGVKIVAVLMEIRRFL